MQSTLKTTVTFEGTGLHSGRPVTMVIAPAPAGEGISFRRTDIDGASPIPARWDQVVPSKLCTLLRGEQGEEISTIEHIMAALAGCGVTNARVALDGPEVPIADGSAAPFVAAIMEAGIKSQRLRRRAIRILKPVEVRTEDGWARIEPADTLEIDFHIDFEDAAIGVQKKHLVMANGAFVRELSNCRTFCRKADVDWMQSNGLALGGVPGENAVVFDGDQVQSGEGLRFDDEPVRHKMLDALGDLALAGAPILGRYVGYRAGHAMTNQLLRALFADRDAWRLVTCDAATESRLPGAHISRRDLATCAA